MLERIETRAAEIGGGLIIRRALPAGGAAWSEPGASSITPGR